MSVDFSKYSHKELLKPEQYIVHWLEENGFNAKLTTLNINKIEFVVERDGVKDILSVTSKRKEYVEDAAEYVRQFLKGFELKCENQRLRKLLSEKQGGK